MFGKARHWLWFGAALAACSINKPEEEGEGGEGDTATARQEPSRGGSSSSSSASTSGTGQSGGEPAGSMQSSPASGACIEGAMRACGPESVLGSCQLGHSTCVQGAWSECEGAIFPAPRDCSSERDDDCDGRPDNSVDDTCRCVPGMREPCGTHPGFDGNGLCVAGERACVLSEDKLSSDWGECAGSVGPGARDSCAVRGDDTDCDGVPNTGCTCVEGDTAGCGPPESVGICVVGTTTCRNNQWGACVGAVNARPRDCRSTLDNDCDGEPDDDLDDFCTCTVGDTQNCGDHPGLDGNGICTEGVQTCVTGNNNSTSAFGACIGSVGPAARDCNSSEDNDCNGVPDSSDATCGCALGAEFECNTHDEDGIGNCQAGTQVCIAGSSGGPNVLGPCEGDVGPEAADACTPGDDANCNGVPNEGCPP